MKPACTAALIAGGRSTRMGEDKCLLVLPATHGLPLWQHQWQTLEALGPQEMRLSARAEQPYFTPVPVLADAWPDAGPLGGIATVMRGLRTPLLMVLGVDLPLVTGEILQHLWSHATETRGAIFHHEGRYEPLAAVYPAGMLADAEARLRAGKYRLQAWVQQAVEAQQMTILSLPPPWIRACQNVNTPEDRALV